MAYTKADLVARSGLASRTIRNYMQLGLLPRPKGHGLAATYDEEALVRVVAIGRMRAAGVGLDQIAADVQGWSSAKWRRYVRDTDPRPAPAPAADPASAAPASPAAPEPPHVEGEPVLPGSAPRRRLGHGDGHDAGPLEEHDGDARLPEATAWCIYPLITGLGLMVDADAPPVVHRVAAEILARYGQGQGRGRR